MKIDFDVYGTDPVSDEIARQVVLAISLDNAPMEKTISQALKAYEELILAVEYAKNKYREAAF